VLVLVFLVGETLFGEARDDADDEVEVEVEVEGVGLGGLEEEVVGNRRMILPGFDATSPTAGEGTSTAASTSILTFLAFFSFTTFSFFGFGSFLGLGSGSGLTTTAPSRGRARASPRLAAGRRMDSGGGDLSRRPLFEEGGAVGGSRFGEVGCGWLA